MSRRDVELSTAVPEAHEKRTITVIQSPPRPAPDDDSAGVMGPAETADSDEDSSRPADPADDDDLVGGAEPAGEDDSAVDAVSAEEVRTRQVLPTRQIMRTQHLPTQQGGQTRQVNRPQQGRLQQELRHQIRRDKIP